MSLSINRLVALACAGLSTALAAPAALAWGPVGHALVADIAQERLDPRAAAQVAYLLRQQKGLFRLDQIASWADNNRKEMPDTGAWHYVDIPLHDDGYVAARDCPNGDCIVDKLSQQAKVLADTSATPAARLRALKWVVHLVGDIHQPLHAEDNHDKGGNLVQVQFFGVGTNLHSVWDGRVINRKLDLQVGPNYTIDPTAVRSKALQLNASITPAEQAKWAPHGTFGQLPSEVVVWADESHRLAQEVAYVDIAQPHGDAWSQRYENRAWPVIETRLKQAGVRLADVLNEALAKPSAHS